MEKLIEALRMNADAHPLDVHQPVMEQAAFEAWLARVCPSGDVDSVHAQWLESSDYADLTAAAPSPSRGGK